MRLVIALYQSPIARTLLAVLVGSVIVAVPVAADVAIGIPGATHWVLATSGDSLSDGTGVLPSGFDNIYWLPTGAGGDGYLFINHEIDFPNGGMSRLRYKSLGGGITERLRWFTGTHFNCSGCFTPHGTILSCEEHPDDGNFDQGWVLEVSPTQPDTWTPRRAMGRFSHESVIVDPVTGDYYMTDDSYAGVFFRFVVQGEDLDSGDLYAYREPTQDWVRITDMPLAQEQALSLGATPYPRLEDLAYNHVDDAIYIMVTGKSNDDTRMGYILRYDPRGQIMTQWLEGDGPVMANPDNVEVDSWGNLLVHEDMYPVNMAEYGANEVLLVRLDKTIQPVLQGTDMLGEPSGLAFAGGDNRFFINWLNGAAGSELIEVVMPQGWNQPAVGVPPSAPAAPAVLRLSAAPNPFYAGTTIEAFGTGASPAEGVRIVILDVRGAHVRTLASGPHVGERFRVHWNGRDHQGRPVASGTYFAQLAGSKRGSATAQLVLLR
jgi:Bacterial protein of unknown function (DUF839)/FlgD Ig-like domain